MKIFWCLIFLVGCSSSPPLPVGTVYSPETTEIVFEVDYMTGAEPYVGDLQNGDPLWSFLRINVEALFDGTKTVTVPTTLEEMSSMAAQGTDYSIDEIVNLAAANRTLLPIDGSTASIYLLFLDGYYEENGQANSAVLGINIGGTGIIAIFKPVIEGSAALPAVKRFVEQMVLIHESGHALGLVNNGLALTSQHQDSGHGAHCTNEDCVMYYLNEGASDVVAFIARLQLTGNAVVFGSECLADAHAAL